MAEILQPHLQKIRMPRQNDRIWKDECVFSYDTPESDTGLYVCLNTFLGFGHQFVAKYYQKTGNAVFLHLRKIKKPIVESDDGEQPKKITRLAIGVEGGFNPDVKKFEYEEQNSIVVLPDFTVVSLDDAALPELVINAVSAVLANDSATKQEELLLLGDTWDGEKRRITRHAVNLPQLDNGKKIPPTGWVCEKCDKTDNLWLNLTDGSILCGRKYFDGTGGNNHAAEYYKEKKYPLAVKLGTISPNGADVYSYDEDDMVEDPLLEEHLAHWGISLKAMKKTDKSMLELEIDMNQRIGEYSTITESDANLTPLYGPGYTGLANLGNSCYLNSVIQVLFTLPEFINRFYNPKLFDNAPNDPSQDFNTQMAKVAFGLLSGAYSKESTDSSQKDQEGIKPIMFKNLVGKNHPEFSTKRQQDAQEFFLHLINMIDRNSRLSGDSDNPTQCLAFQVEERIECASSKKVKYTTRSEYILPLPIPLESATNYKEYKESEEKRKLMEIAGERFEQKDIVRAKIALDKCIETLAEPETIEDFFSTAIGAKTVAKKTSRLKTFPDYLVLQLKKFALGDDWVPKKLDIEVEVPEQIDLSHLRGRGQQPSEQLLPDSNPSSDQGSPAPITFDEGQIAQLMDMGFTVNACKRAIHNTGNTGVESALNWLFEHNTDEDINDHFTLGPTSVGASVGGRGGASDVQPDPESIEALKAMGMSEQQATLGLKATNNNVERAVDWIFSHPDEIAAGVVAMDTDEGSQGASGGGAPSTSLSAERSQASYRDGTERYQLMAFISHMGSSTLCGHYVCHIRKQDRWVIFNDNKVAVSEHPPKELAYLYLYKRV